MTGREEVALALQWCRVTTVNSDGCTDTLPTLSAHVRPVRPTKKTCEGSLLRDDDTPQKSEPQQKPTKFLDDSTATSTLQSDCHMSGRFKKECLLNTITAMQHCRRPCARGCSGGRETFTEREIHLLALKSKLSPWFDVCSFIFFWVITRRLDVIVCSC